MLSEGREKGANGERGSNDTAVGVPADCEAPTQRVGLRYEDTGTASGTQSHGLSGECWESAAPDSLRLLRIKNLPCVKMLPVYYQY